ncbi:MAG TPA: hypothetical protein VF746_08870 [Longimicrobium sp.]|jgi:hypothetical protein
METLAPRAAYDEIEPGQWVRLAVLIGVFCGGLMALLTLLEQPVPRSVPAMVATVVTWLVGGLFFGAAWIWLMRRLLRNLVDRVYAGDPKVAPPPPPGREYLYRLPCAMLAGRIAVGGVLYLGPQGAVFQPHRRNVRRHRAPVILEPVEALRARRVELAPPRTAGPLLKATPRALELSAGAATARFMVPMPETTLAVLESRIAALAAS